MKKCLYLATALLISVGAMATQTAKVTIKVAGDTYPSNQGQLILVENSDRTNLYESGRDVAFNASVVAATPVAYLLGLVDHDAAIEDCERVETNNLVGLKLVFITNGAQNGACDHNYTMTFSNISGHAIALKDHEADSIITIVNGMTPTTYQFTVDAAIKGQQRILDRFEIINPYAPIAYQCCYKYDKFIIDNPLNEVDSIFVLKYNPDQADDKELVEKHEVKALASDTIIPTSLVDETRYRVVVKSHLADTLVFRHKPTPVTPAP